MATEQLDELENAVRTLKLQRQQKELPEKNERLINNQPKELEAEIGKNSLTELKSLANPPEMVKTTLSAFMLVLGHPVTDAKVRVEKDKNIYGKHRYYYNEM
ncbi:hypothetical protein LOTGIDRAFT_171566 [Lottia gigantea]|uniref:Uncharacterized protein n=1 Tax=Lottia gigantea TaxID=225164 RepID=V4BBC1_LOTGI|nr:hypothetical protein LOTGIDRAFT_171566 [Lottia gigantea]ESP03332.1 hypothetical protein LOTGIDRAFT_171566 [Lottia gigantea]